jgi:hypothetical protein
LPPSRQANVTPEIPLVGAKLLACVRDMKPQLKFAAILAVAATFLLTPFRHALAEDDDEDDQYSFKVHNTTSETITKLLASEDGKDYGNFDLGEGGIPAGKTVTLNWDKKTNDQGCDWYFKAVFEGGDESAAKKFDFCEEDLELEF